MSKEGFYDKRKSNWANRCVLQKKRGRILTILSAFVLFGLSFTLSSCEKCGKKENVHVPPKNVFARGVEFLTKACELIAKTESVIANAKKFKDERAKVTSDDWKIEDPTEALRQAEDFVRAQIKKVEPVTSCKSSKIVELERYVINHKIKQNMDGAAAAKGGAISGNGGERLCAIAMYEFNKALLEWKVAVDEFNKAVDEFNKLIK
jgi:hypothetical protein